MFLSSILLITNSSLLQDNMHTRETEEKAQVLLESVPSWYDFSSELHSAENKMLMRKVEEAMLELSKYDTDVLRRVVYELSDSVVPNSKAAIRFARRHNLSQPAAIPLADRKLTTIIFLNRFLFDAPSFEPKGSPVFMIGSKLQNGSVDRHWPLLKVGSSFILIADDPGGGSGPRPEWRSEFNYFAAKYARRKLVSDSEGFSSTNQPSLAADEAEVEDP